MKIAIMMRPMDQDSGFRAYTEALIDHMLKLDQENQYLLLYRQPKFFGRFAAYPHVKEMLVNAPHKFLWDQVAVPYIAWKEHADVIFNPKFSVPLFSPVPVTMGLQEPAWWTEPEYYEKWDVRYEKFMVPRCIRKSKHIFPMSKFILDENRKVLGLPLENTTVIYAAPDRHFQPVQDPSALAEFKAKYNLPEKFILLVTRVDHPGLEGSTSFYPGKNPETALRAFLKIRDRIPHQIVFAGRRVKEYLQWTEGAGVDLDRAQFITFIPYEELHMLYNAADLFVNPAPYEGCPNTVLQAMACGRPMVVASSGGSADVASGAALFAEPRNEDDFAEKMLAALNDETLCAELSRKSLDRSKNFRWEESARLCVEGLERATQKKYPMVHAPG